MRGRVCCGIVSLAALLAAAACGSSPAAPAVSTAAPQLLTPANGAQVANQAQPVTLVVQNAAGSKAGTTYTFEVASDVGVHHQGADQGRHRRKGPPGRPACKLDALPAPKDYYWRARAQAPGGTGTFSDLFKFTIGGGDHPGRADADRPAHQRGNHAAAGAAREQREPIGIDRRRSPTSSKSPETRASARSSSPAPTRKASTRPASFRRATCRRASCLFWRATAIDAANSVTSSPSTVQSFTPLPFSQAESVAQQLGVVLWPGKVPPGAVGHATMGDNWQIQTLHYLPGNVFFQSPDVEMLRIFDLLDRGFDPDGAAGWMNTQRVSHRGALVPAAREGGHRAAVRVSGVAEQGVRERHVGRRAASGVSSACARQIRAREAGQPSTNVLLMESGVAMRRKKPSR